jgi:hypothetical protein
MTFQLHFLDKENGLTLDVALADSDRELLSRQLTRCISDGGPERFARWLGAALGASLPTVVDYDLRPPTEPQVSFAMAIARTLSVALSPDVLRYRGAMHEFLSTNKAEYERRRSGGS